MHPKRNQAHARMPKREHDKNMFQLVNMLKKADVMCQFVF